MSQETPPSLNDPWVVRSVAAVVAIFVGATILGFVVFPLVQPNGRASSLWDAICSAAGVVREPTSQKPIEPDFKVSPAVMTSDMLRGADADSIGHGATLAQQCAICHGPTGVSRGDSPNLAGQYPAVIYKELQDFQTGARVNAIMTPFALRLSGQDMIDLASYYA
jgi:cytochrome c553